MHDTDIDWGAGRVLHWRLDVISDVEPLALQAHSLTEDLARAIYPNGKWIDVGWYPDCSPSGGFRVFVVASAL